MKKNTNIELSLKPEEVKILYFISQIELDKYNSIHKNEKNKKVEILKEAIRKLKQNIVPKEDIKLNG